MRYLLTALLTMALVAPFAWSRITILPSDDTAGGGAGNIYWSETFGGGASVWPTTLLCMRVTGGNGSNYVNCATEGDAGIGLGKAYTGQLWVENLECASYAPPGLWTGGGQNMRWGVFEAKGDNGIVTFERNQIGGYLEFTASDSNLVTKSVTINNWTTLENGVLEVGLVSEVEGAGATVADSGFYCTVNGIR